MCLKEHPLCHSSLTLRFSESYLQLHLILKTAPVLPGVCVGGPEATTESCESNKDAVEGIVMNTFLIDIRHMCVGVCVYVINWMEGRNSHTQRTTVGKWDTCEPIWEDLK